MQLGLVPGSTVASLMPQSSGVQLQLEYPGVGIEMGSAVVRLDPGSMRLSLVLCFTGMGLETWFSGVVLEPVSVGPTCARMGFESESSGPGLALALA